jgi:hypothetical protein
VLLELLIIRLQSRYQVRNKTTILHRRRNREFFVLFVYCDRLQTPNICIKYIVFRNINKILGFVELRFLHKIHILSYRLIIIYKYF